MLDASRFYPELRGPGGAKLPSEPCSPPAGQLAWLAERVGEAYQLAGAVALDLPDGDPDVVRLLDMLGSVSTELDRLSSVG